MELRKRGDSGFLNRLALIGMKWAGTDHVVAFFRAVSGGMSKTARVDLERYWRAEERDACGEVDDYSEGYDIGIDSGWSGYGVKNGA